MMIEPESKQVTNEEEKFSNMINSGNVEHNIKSNLKFNVKYDEFIFQTNSNKIST